LEQRIDGVGGVVLLVDDDAALAEAVKFAMELEGFAVQTYPDGESLLNLKSFPKRGCLVIDVKLPGVDGLELLRRLRARRVMLPAVLITTNPPPSLRIHAAGRADRCRAGPGRRLSCSPKGLRLIQIIANAGRGPKWSR
jgi:two-component system response regulator FixJ